MRSTANCKVPVTSLFTSLEKPMWLSLICAKEKSPFSSAAAGAAKARELKTPPCTVQMMPVPTQAMHLRKPRRSTPSTNGSNLLRSDMGLLQKQVEEKQTVT